MMSNYTDLVITGERAMIMNINHPNKQGVLFNPNVNIKIPTDKKEIKHVCNYEIRVNIERALLNVNKKFMKSFVKFFVKFHTLAQINKALKKVVMKQYYQDELLY